MGVVVPAQSSGLISGTVTTEPRKYQGIPGLRVTEIPIALTKGSDGKPSLSNLLVDTGNGVLQPADGPITFPNQSATVTLMHSGEPTAKVTRGLTVQQHAPLPVSRDITTSPVSFPNGIGVIHGAGRFSGDSGRMLLALNDEPMPVVAANKDAIFFQLPPDASSGPTRLTMVDGELAASTPLTVVKLVTSVDQPNLLKHQRTNGHVGLQADGLPAEAWNARGGADRDLVDVSEIQKFAPDFHPPQAEQPGVILVAIRNLSPDKISIDGFKGTAKVFSLKKDALPFNETLRIQAKADGNFEVSVVAQPLLGQVGMTEFLLAGK